MAEERKSLDEMLRKEREKFLFDNLGRDSSNPLARKWLEKARKAWHRPLEQIACYGMAISLDPACANMRVELAIIWEIEENYDAAIECYKKVLELELDKEEKAQIHNHLARAYVAKGKYDWAVEHCEKAIELCPELSSSYYYSLGFHLRRKGEHKSAIEYLNKSLEFDPQSAQYWEELSIAYSELGEHEKAILCRKKVAELEPDLVTSSFLVNFGLSYSKTGRDEEAIKCYTDALKIEPDNKTAHNNLGVVYERIGEEELSKEHFRKAKELEKNDK
jgi:tetratricopeptide (TPR) repeat protein